MTLNRLLLFVQKDHLDLCHTSIDEQFDAYDITAVIRSEEQGRFRDFVRTSRRYTRREQLQLEDPLLHWWHMFQWRLVRIVILYLAPGHQLLDMYAKFPFYAKMFADAGFPLTAGQNGYLTRL